ncbi:MAG: Fic family protein [Butyricicoccus sp.]|nr:Fic family protein [Butyricicoccus sp.]
MRNRKPPFEVTASMLNDITEIAELVGHVNASPGLSASPMLRRTNRIRTIYSSLAIEQNTLSLDQVTAVLSGKRVIAPPKDIAEVKNAYEIYEMMDKLDPYSMDDLLDAHGVMTRNLVEESGCFRTRPVGVVDKQGNILHFGTLPDYIPGLVMELLDWVRDSDFHMLIKSCVFHYELELIHPFADGNGRIGRLWHTLLLTRWKPLFAWLPVESIIHDRQEEYYQAINRSNNEAESTAFIEFMLSTIKEALLEAVQAENAENMSIEEQRWCQIKRFLKKHGTITNADVREMLGVSPATANRILARMTAKRKIQKIRIGKSWGYVISPEEA